MKKSELVKVLAENLELPQTKTNDTLKVVFETLTSVLASGETVSIPGFGKFSTKVNAARTCRNPQTQEPMEVPEKRVPKFKASSVLKERVL